MSSRLVTVLQTAAFPFRHGCKLIGSSALLLSYTRHLSIAEAYSAREGGYETADLLIQTWRGYGELNSDLMIDSQMSYP